MKARRLILIPLILFFSLTSAAQGTTDKRPREVIILHVNDMHSKIDNLAKLAYLADSLRRLNPNVIIVSAGDNFTGNPVVDMVPDKGAPMIDLMNRCGFVVSAMGNHEFDMGQELLKNKFRQAVFPYICCNLDGSAAPMGAVKPYTVVDAGGGDSLAFIGLLQLDDNGLPSAMPTHMEGVTFTPGITKARDFTWLKQKYGNLIALSHLGFMADSVLADSVPQFDLIIGGHSHLALEQPKMENGVMIVQAGAHLKHIGKTTLTIEKGKITGRKDELIPCTLLSGERLDIKAVIDRYNNNPEFDKVVGNLEKPMTGADELGSMMADALTDLLQVDIAFQNRGGIRLQSLPQGEIRLRDIYKLDPFSNDVMLYSMTGEEIRSLICYGYQHERAIDIHVSGMTYVITDDGNHRCAGIEMFDRNGKPIDPKSEYSVAMNSYIANAYRFEHNDPGTVTKYTTTEALIHYLRQHPSLNYSGIKRATVK